MSVYERFQTVLNELGVATSRITELWPEIEARYGEPHRHYHRLSHIAAMLNQAKALGVEDVTVTLAIIYHDLIYDPARRDNEAQSATVFSTHLGAYLPPALCERICLMIEATKSHQPTGNDLTDLLLDLDMAILGAAWSDYEAYAEGVAREYVPIYGAEAYRTGRADMFLKPVLAQKQIFLTPAFSKYEDQARDNLRRELTGLQSPSD